MARWVPLIVLAVLWWAFGSRLWLSVLPFLLALGIAALLDAPVKALGRALRLPRSLATLLAMALLVAAGGLLFFGVGAAAVAQVRGLIAQIPHYRDELALLYDSLLARVQALAGRLPEGSLELLAANRDRILAGIQRAGIRAGEQVLRGAAAVPSFLSIGLITLLASYFFTRDWDYLGAQFRALLPPRWRERWPAVRVRLLSNGLRYLRAQVILIALTTLIATLWLFFLLRIPNWLVIGLIAGILDLLPVVGPGLIFVPWGLYLLFGGATWPGLLLLLLFGTTSLVRQLVEARVVGASVGVHPAITLAVFYGSVVLFGVTGLLAAPLIVILGKAAWEAELLRWPGRKQH